MREPLTCCMTGAEQGIVRQLEALRQGISMRMLPGVTVEAPVAKQPARSSITCGRITLSTIPPESTFRLAWDAVGESVRCLSCCFMGVRALVVLRFNVCVLR